MKRTEIPITDAQSGKQEGASKEETHQDVPTAHSGSEQSHDEMVAVLEEKVRELETENETLRDQRLRAIADLDNARRRAQQDVLNTVRYANEELLRKLLPILDDFSRSVEAGSEAKDSAAFYDGVVMIKNKIVKTLEELDVKKIDAVGKPFDVEYHEALMRQPSEQPEDTVVTELEPGYIYKDKVIRHAKVIVSAGEA